MDTKHYDIPTPNLDEPAELEQYLHDVMVKIDATMHELDLCVDTRLPRPVVHELTRLRCDLLAVIAEVRKFGCIVRANQKAVADMLLKVKRMEIKVDAINKELADLKILVEEITKHLEENDITLEEHTKKLTDYKRYLDRHKEQIAELRKDFEEVSTELSELTNRVDSNDTILDEHTTELQEHQEALDAQKEQINTMNHGIGELDKRCSTVEQKVATLETCCEEVNNKFETINRGIGELDNRTTNAEENIRNNTEQIRNNLIKIQEIIGAESTEGITSIKILSQLLTEYTTKVNNNTTNIDALEETVQQNKNDSDTKIEQNKTDIDSLREDVNNNTTDVTTSIEGLTQNLQNVIESANSTHSEINNKITALEESVGNMTTGGIRIIEGDYEPRNITITPGVITWGPDSEGNVHEGVKSAKLRAIYDNDGNIVQLISLVIDVGIVSQVRPTITIEISELLDNYAYLNIQASLYFDNTPFAGPSNNKPAVYVGSYHPLARQICIQNLFYSSVLEVDDTNLKIVLKF